MLLPLAASALRSTWQSLAALTIAVQPHRKLKLSLLNSSVPFHAATTAGAFAACYKAIWQGGTQVACKLMVSTPGGTLCTASPPALPTLSDCPLSWCWQGICRVPCCSPAPT